MRPDCAHPVIAILDLILGLTFLVFFLFIVPARYPLITIFFVLLGLTTLASAWGLWIGKQWGRLLARITSAVAITFGTGFTLLCLGAASYLSGVYGGMGKASSSIFFVMMGLALILLVLLPSIQLFHLRNSVRPAGDD
ncbi:MAG TPA: hypothetical protein PLD82_02820 [Spirochaetota bacterium]|nr:hypothetical protein [Spirochaetota bacterium]HPH01860.1 hypothetical protein [Spirochaetota bacterium]